MCQTSIFKLPFLPFSRFYSVRTAYYLARHLKKQSVATIHGNSSNLVQENWDFVWKISLPNKIKIFAWRLLKSALPVLDTLRRRNIVIDVLCPVCQCRIESIIHVFRDCHYARISWALSPIPNLLLQSDLGDAWHWFLEVKDKLSKEDFDLFVCICWSIWRNRNRVVHEGRRDDPAMSASFAPAYVQEFKAAQPHFSRPRPPETSPDWQPPAVGSFKVNFDASVTCSTPSIGLGVVVHNHMGNVIVWSRRRIHYLQDPEIAEGLAALLAVQLADRLKLSRVIIEGDCSNIIWDICSTDPCLSPAGNSIAVIRSLIPSFMSISFCLVPRQSNSLAHNLSRAVTMDEDGGSVLPTGF